VITAAVFSAPGKLLWSVVRSNVSSRYGSENVENLVLLTVGTH